MGQYTNNILDTIGSGQIPKKLEKPEDFLQYAHDKIFPLDEKGGKEHYSNVGTLLVGLAIMHHYNKDKVDAEKKSYNQILEENIIKPAGMEMFLTANPGNACTNPSDVIAPHICGSPAGCYWTTQNDLQKFGQWICKEWKNSQFQESVKKHGGEFYDSKTGEIRHGGNIPTASAYLSVFPQQEKVVVALSNQQLRAVNIAENICRSVADHEIEDSKTIPQFQPYQNQSTSGDVKESFVEKLELKKPDEKTRSFVEAMQAGKYGNIGSKGGAHEL